MYHETAFAGGVRQDSCRVVGEVGQVLGDIELEQDTGRWSVIVED